MQALILEINFKNIGGFKMNKLDDEKETKPEMKPEIKCQHQFYSLNDYGTVLKCDLCGDLRYCEEEEEEGLI
jgi:hypothetical protein